MKVIAVVNPKGGVGKTTTARFIGAGLLRKGRKVLFIDLDSRGNLSYSMGADYTGEGAMSVINKRAKIDDHIQRTGQGDIMPSSPGFADADVAITATGKELRLKKALKEMKSSYDFVIIDTPGDTGVLTVNALVAADGCIIPAQADIYSAQAAFIQLLNKIQDVTEDFNSQLAIMGIVLTCMEKTIIDREAAEEIERAAKKLKIKLYKTRISKCTAIKRSNSAGKDIFEYAPDSKAAAEYGELVAEILRGCK
jgi:chromosome partitioning protein